MSDNYTLLGGLGFSPKAYASEGADDFGRLYISIEQDKDKIKYKPAYILLLYTLLEERKDNKDDKVLDLEEI